MTRDDILALKPGIELDALVLQHIFNEQCGCRDGEMVLISEHGNEVPCFSRYFSEALIIVEVLRPEWEIKISMPKGKWEIGVRVGDASYKSEDGAEAICKAALLAHVKGDNGNERTKS